MTAIVLDTETTGLEPRTARIVELTIVEYETGDLLFHCRFDPEVPIPPDATAVHGITDEMVVGLPKFREHAATIALILGRADAMIGFNPQYDKGMVGGEFSRLGMSCQLPPAICSKRLWSKHEPRNLTAAYKRFVDPAGFSGAHGSMADTLATRAVMLAQVREFGLEGKPWSEFGQEMVVWVGPSNHIICDDATLKINFGKHRGVAIQDVDLGYWRWILNQDFPDHVKEIGDYMTIVYKPGVTTPEELYGWAYTKYIRREL